MNIPCIECHEDVDLGEIPEEVMRERMEANPWLANVICNDCLKTKFDIDMDEINELIDSDSPTNTQEG